MLPEGNQVAGFVYEAKKIICPLGLEVERIHACKNNCVLFRGEYEDLDNCPKCGFRRYKRIKDGGDNADDGNDPVKIRGKKGNGGGPVRVAWYFPIIPRLNACLPHERRLNSCVGIRKAVRRWAMESLGTPQM